MPFRNVLLTSRRYGISHTVIITPRLFLAQKVCERVLDTWWNSRFSAFLYRFDWFSEFSAERRTKRKFYHVPKTLSQTISIKNKPCGIWMMTSTGDCLHVLKRPKYFTNSSFSGFSFVRLDILCSISARYSMWIQTF